MFDDVVTMTDQHVLTVANEFGCAAGGELSCAVQRLQCEVIAARRVEDHHVERCRGGALFAVTVNVEAIGTGAAVQDLVERARVAMKREYHVGVGGEEVDERDGG